MDTETTETALDSPVGKTSSFFASFMQLVADSLGNDYNDNYDARRFGPKNDKAVRIKTKIARLLQKCGLMTTGAATTAVSTSIGLVTPRLEQLEWLYSSLADQTSRDLLVSLMAFRALGYRKVKLPLNRPEYWATLDRLDELTKGQETIPLGYLDWKIHKMNLSSLGYPLEIFFSSLGVYADFVGQQYRCETESGTIEAAPGDTVIDAGGCYGDTALYFSLKAGASGKVYSFEFLPSNISVFHRNMTLNPEVASRVQLIERPVWSASEQSLFVVEYGPGTHVTPLRVSPTAIEVSTMTIDDLSRQHALDRVDFIKMDIEGAELEALKGAEQVLKMFRPKLAIALYHRLDDFWAIPKYLESLGLGYQFYVRHFTTHSEETILFAKAI